MPGRGHRDDRSQTGSATAETALALPAVVLALGLLVGVAEVGTAHVRSLDAARAAARRAARGDGEALVTSAARAAAPDGAAVVVGRSGATVVVTVATPVRLPLPGVPVVRVTARAVADAEAGR